VSSSSWQEPQAMKFSLAKFATAAVEERQQVLAQGAKSILDQRWAAPAIAEAWCIARIGLSNGSLNRHSAMCVIGASLHRDGRLGG
jgi:hypothetical protein